MKVEQMTDEQLEKRALIRDIRRLELELKMEKEERERLEEKVAEIGMEAIMKMMGESE